MHRRYWIPSLTNNMKKLLAALAFLLLPTLALAQLNTHQGGTGLVDISSGSVPFGSVFNLRLGTSSNFQFNNAASRLTVTNASTTALSATVFCLTGDTCRTTWPSGGGGGASTTLLGDTNTWTGTENFTTNTGFGVAAPSQALDIIGKIRASNTTTDATNKAFYFLDRNFTNAQNDFLLVFGQSKTSSNTLIFGGGQTGFTAATTIAFFTGAGNNTDTGTSRLNIDATGIITIPNLTGGGVASGPGGVLYNFSTTSMNASITGLAGTATALAANGTNCSAGNYPLGVDASGNVESCTAAAVGTVTSVTATYPIASTGGATPVISTNFGTTTTWGMGNNGIVMTGATGIPFSQATSSAIALNISGNAATVTTNANLSGVVTSSGNVTSFGSQTAGVLGSAVTGNTSVLATSTLYGIVTPGFHLAFLNGAWTPTATSTFSCSSGITCSFAGNQESYSIAGNALTLAMFPTIGANTVIGNSTGSTGTPTAVATSSLFTFGAGLVQTSNTISQVEHPSFQYATSTGWTGTTTIFIQLGYGEVFNSVRCSTDAGTLGVDFYHASSHLNYITTASTTANVFLFTTNNTITDGDLTKVDIGTPVSSPTKIICTVKDTI